MMSFGASKPIAVRVIGTDYDLVREHAEKIAANLKKIEYLRDVGFEQTLDYPTVEVEIDRELAGLIGVTPMHLKHALVMATSSTRFTNLNYWINDKTGFDYLVQIQVPPLRMEKPEDIEELPLQSVNPVVPLMVRDVLTDGRVHTSTRPGEYDRDMSQRYVTVVANVEGEDMGRAAKQVRQAVKDAGEAPRGVHVEEQGSAPHDDPDVRGPGDRAGGCGVRHPRPPDGLFSVAPAGADLAGRRAGRAGRHRDRSSWSPRRRSTSSRSWARSCAWACRCRTR